jgi:hypothetical protein
MAKIIANLEISMQVVSKNGLHYAMVWDTETMNLIFETECLTRQGAETCLGNFVIETLGKQ